MQDAHPYNGPSASAFNATDATRPPLRAVLRSRLALELKYDGFRALAHLSNGDCKLISRNGNAFRSFESLRAAIPGDLTPQRTVIDGEIICLDAQGRSRFTDLLLRRAEPRFYAYFTHVLPASEPPNAVEATLRQVLRRALQGSSLRWR